MPTLDATSSKHNNKQTEPQLELHNYTTKYKNTTTKITKNKNTTKKTFIYLSHNDLKMVIHH